MRTTVPSRARTTARAVARAAAVLALVGGMTFASAMTAQAAGRATAPSGTAKSATPAPARLFGVTADRDLVSMPADGGSSTIVARAVVDYAVNAAATAFAITDSGVVRITASGATKTLSTAPFATRATAIALDAKGDVFLLDGSTVVKIAAGTTTATTVVTTPSVPVGFGISPAGTVRVLLNRSNVHSVVAYPVSGSPVTTVLDDSPYSSPVSATFDDRGNLYYGSVSTGASGSLTFSTVARTGTTPVSLGGGFAVGGLGSSDDFYVLEAASWCSAYGIGTVTCAPDLSVGSLSVTSDHGVTTSVAVDGLRLSTLDQSNATRGTSVTSDEAGRVYVAQAGGVIRFSAAGGASARVTAAGLSDIRLSR